VGNHFGAWGVVGHGEMGRGILVDDRGESWPETSQYLCRNLGTERSGPDLIRFLVRNLGFVHIRPGTTGCIIGLAEDAASPHSLIGALYWLNDHRPERVIIEALPHSTAPRRMLDFAQAHRFLSGLCETRTARAPFTRTPTILFESSFANRWEAAKEVLSATEMSDPLRLLVLDKLLQGYFSISCRDKDTGRYLVQHISFGISSHHPALNKVKVGQPFSAFDDRPYGAWLDSTFTPLTQDSMPYSEHIEATLGADTSNAKRIQYARLVLPFVRSDELYLLTASHIY
jgi:hypothetical protein